MVSAVQKGNLTGFHFFLYAHIMDCNSLTSNYCMIKAASQCRVNLIQIDYQVFPYFSHYHPHR